MKKTPPSFLTDQQECFLCVAAMFNGDFSIEWIESLVEMKASQLFNILEEAIEKKWIVKKRPGIYRFKDLKKQQELLNSLPQGEKEKLHRLISETLMKLIPSEPNAVKASAEHLLHIDNDINGLRILQRAGDLYRKNHVPQKAFQYYNKILHDITKIKSNAAADDLFIDTAIRYSKVFSTAPTETDMAIKHLREALARATARKYQDQVAIIKLHLTKNQWLIGQFDLAVENYYQGIAVAKNISDPKFKRSIETFKPFWHFWHGRSNDAVSSYEKLISEMENFQPQKLPLIVPCTVGICYAHTGRYSQGLGMLNTIRSYSQEIGDMDIFCFSGITIGAILIFMGQIPKAIDYLENAFEDGQRISDWAKCWRIYTLAWAYFINENVEQSVKYLKEYFQFNREKRYNTQYIPYLFEILWAMEKETYPKINGLSLESEINVAIKAINIYFKGVAYRYKGLLDFKKGESHEVVMESFHRSLDLLQTAGHRMETAKTELEMGRVFLCLGDQEKAKSMVKSASKFLLTINKSLIPDDLFHLTRDIPKKDDLLEEILNLGQEITSITDNRKLDQHILSAVNRITGAERGAIFLLDKTTDPPKIKLKASRNLLPEEIDKPAFKSSMDLIQKAAEKGEPFIKVMDVAQDSSMLLNNAIRSCICVPMMFQDKVEGILYNDNSMLNSVFKESDLNIFTYFASQAAVSLLNARSYEELQNQNRKLRDEKEYYSDKITTEPKNSGDFIINSSAMKKVLDHAMQVAKTNSTVLMLGETGVGKEMVAREIHNKSSRREKPFICVDCSALPKELLSSELFGHEKGSFSGAVAKRLGRFELADGGTIFLDEIGDIPLDVQVRLLRVLQSKEFERVGGEKTLHSDFRLLAATNRDLLKEVKAGMFREDLYYRINVYPIYIPPLRERKDDIPSIADHYFRIYAKKFGKSVKKIPSEEIFKLLNYNWPGNVRELINIIERSTILSSGSGLRIIALDAAVQDHPRHEANMTLAENERIHILETLKRTSGKVRGKGGAAELLGINYSTLYSRMRKLGITKSMIFN